MKMHNTTHTSVVPHVISTCLGPVTNDWVHSTIVNTPWAVKGSGRSLCFEILTSQIGSKPGSMAINDLLCGCVHKSNVSRPTILVIINIIAPYSRNSV